MDDLIVIIITLAVAGIGILGQLKKKKKQAAAGTNQPKQPDSFWDLINGRAEVLVQEEEIEFNEEADVKPNISSESLSQKLNSKPKKTYGKDAYAIKKSTGKKVRSKTLEGFSLRKAVIYSEILNRKYT